MNKKKGFGLFIVLAICATLAFAVFPGTNATYLDEEVIPDSQFVAGSIDLVTCRNNVIEEDVKPGYWGHGGLSIHNGIIGILQLKNEGTNPGMLTYLMFNLQNLEGTNWEPEGNQAEPGDLGPVLIIDRFVVGTSIAPCSDGYPVKDGYKVTGIFKTITVNQSINDFFAGGGSIDLGVKLDPGQTVYVEFFWHIPAGEPGEYNDIMGDIVQYGEKLYLAQMPIPTP